MREFEDITGEGIRAMTGSVESTTIGCEKSDSSGTTAMSAVLHAGVPGG